MGSPRDLSATRPPERPRRTTFRRFMQRTREAAEHGQRGQASRREDWARVSDTDRRELPTDRRVRGNPLGATWTTGWPTRENEREPIVLGHRWTRRCGPAIAPPQCFVRSRPVRTFKTQAGRLTTKRPFSPFRIAAKTLLPAGISAPAGRSRPLTAFARQEHERDPAPPRHPLPRVAERCLARVSAVPSSRRAPVTDPAPMFRLHDGPQAPAKSASNGSSGDTVAADPLVGAAAELAAISPHGPPRCHGTVGHRLSCSTAAMRRNERRAFQPRTTPSSRRNGRHRGGGCHSIRPFIQVPPFAVSKSLVQR